MEFSTQLLRLKTGKYGEDGEDSEDSEDSFAFFWGGCSDGFMAVDRHRRWESWTLCGR